MTKLSRWIGLLEVTSESYIDDTPIFYPENDPFVVRFKVKPLVWLEKEKAVPIHEAEVWDSLSFTRGQDKNSPRWTGKIRSSLVTISDSDGKFLEDVLYRQQNSTNIFPIADDLYEKLLRHRVRTLDKVVMVTVPQDADLPQEKAINPENRESIKIQALLARIGATMGMKIWIPRSDRTGVLQEWQPEPGVLLERLPLNYDETTLKTIEQIDVLWFKGRSIARAFEVEHTTSIYSGLLRMADLIALQPNMNIHLHIVAPSARREKVLREITRPVFALLERPLQEICTYISYDSVEELSKLPHLSHTSDSILDEYSEEAE